ncbi:GntR family transcriptional regulator [Kitasatospora sp. MMS16-BH015]|uniref:TetR/AcrR family transcriptional regulator C-terminal domain-containing protein n=1 Tax=Kitasatospora sp. MMS16-BH015 TaxID=2018025 RepID=UPI000CA0C8FD|nr:TetR/AcrR family transcriptional regulator C-terminal domain-containing protein [Kitasatospora sp. MMS16-BH015]AUG75202.1 GntR family transcriptional regulator [Kitasatospora sp. MMS16-BH015]
MERAGAGKSGEIVAELRGRIESGELGAGERVPSTRDITRQWGVAMATATKVLAELRREGLVRAVPGVGTVVAERERPAGGGQPGEGGERSGTRRRAGVEQALTLERIVVTAVAVADGEGLAAVSMRRVAAELGVATMSLYRHVTDKDDLLLRMMDQVFAQWPLPAEPAGGWRDRVGLAARLIWRMFRAHPWLASALSVTRPQPLTNAIPIGEWVLAALAAEGLDLETALTTYLVILNFVRGTAINLESEAESEARTGLDQDQWMDSQEPDVLALLATGAYPTFARVAEVGYDFDLDSLFEFGLERMLDGVAPMIEARARG